MKQFNPFPRDLFLITTFSVVLTVLLFFLLGITDRAATAWLKRNTIFHLTNAPETLPEENFRQGKYLVPSAEDVKFFVVKGKKILVEYKYSNDHLGRRKSYRSTNMKGKPGAVLIFGDSFAFGFGSNDEDTLASWINKTQNNFVAYNYGIIGSSPRETYMITKNRDLSREVSEPIKYMIYVYINGQYERLSRFLDENLPKVSLANGEIHENWNRSFFERPFQLFFQSRISNGIRRLFTDMFLGTTNADLFCSLLAKSRDSLASQNPDMKLIILNYDPWGKDTNSEQKIKNCATKLNAQLMISPSRGNTEDFYPIDEHPRPLANKKNAEFLLESMIP